MKHRHHIFSLVFAVVLLLPLPVRATISSYTPTTAAELKNSYYTNLEGKNGSTLFSAVVTATGGVKHTYTKLTYDELWTAYITSDVYPTGHAHAGKIWDMYANCYYATSAHVTQMKAECDGGYNREHSLPKSWFGGSSDYKNTNQGCDLVHLVPTDAYVNSDRGNYAFGEVGTVVKQFEISKRGTSVNTLSVSKSTISGTSVSTGAPTVFEPADDYKGDFARIYFYMRAHYPSLNLAQADGGTKHFSSTTSAASDSKYGLTDYSVILLMKWHRQDPVSQKEIDRNNAIEKMQGNRNPFVDYPCLAEYLWGEHAGETFSLSTAVGSFENSFTPGVSDGCACSTEPTLTVNPTSLTVDPVAVNGTSTKTFTVTGANLTGNITITKTSGSGYFTVSSSSIAAASANGSNTITVTYHPTAIGDHTATFTIASNGATNKTVTVSGTCTTVYTATWMANGSQYHQNTAADGSAPSVPEAPNDCGDDRVFMGWTDNENYSGNGSGLFTDEAPIMTTDKTFYAVYADKTEGASGTATFTASDISSTPLAGTNTWTHTASVITLSLSAGQRYTSGTPNTFTVTKGTSNYAQLSGDKTITQVVATISGDNYKINSTTPGSLTTSGITQTISNINSTSVKMTATTDYQIRLTQLEVTYTSVSYDNYSTQCTASSCTLSSITLNTSSVQKSFAVGDAFNYTGLIVTANYSDCENKTVTPTSVSSPDMSTTGDKTVTVSYIESGTTKTATYTITVEAAPEYTVTFMNMGGTHATCTGTAGSAISAVSDPTACSGYTFEGWSTSQYAVDNTVTPSLSTPTTIPVGGVTYYAVYSKTEGSGSSSTSNITASASLVSGSTSGYTFATGKNGGSSNPTYNSTGRDVRLYAKNQITISASSTITQIVFNLSTQGKKRLASIEASAGTIATQNSGDNKVTWTGSATSVTFTVGDKATYGGDGASKAGQLCFTSVDITSGSGSSTTYHTTAPDCSCTATITATSNDDSMGTASVTTP